MNKLLYIIPIILFLSCNKNSQDNKNSNTSDTLSHSDTQSNSMENYPSNDAQDETQILYVVIADTSLDYYYLHDKMFELSKKLNMPIDTMGRYYNTSKNMIVLPDNDEDEVYAGNYFPRRFPAMDTSNLSKSVPEYLSLEYLNVYKNSPNEKMISLVSGIYEDSLRADGALGIIKSEAPLAFVIKTNMYIGCIH